MRKTFVWALVAMMAVAGSAFAQTLPGGAPATLDNDSTCDISVAPAATLLLPYFEVDIDAEAGVGDTTLFTVTNTSAFPQIAHVTVWTDWSAPVLDFNIFLTGYDVQAINLYDIIARGRIAPEDGTSSDTEEGIRSADNDGFDADGDALPAGSTNPNIDVSNCDRLAVRVPNALLADVQAALTTGVIGCGRVGSTQADGLARGYLTIDVARSCSVALPTDANYATTELLFDNTLIGDYQQVDPANNFAQGGPLVHIRAIPEGGPAGDFSAETNFDRTFYSRYQAGGVADRRQPLPSTFAARWIDGSGDGFETSLKIWREGTTGAGVTCGTTGGVPRMSANAFLTIVEFVRFDEAENPVTFAPDDIISPAPDAEVVLPETSRTDIDDTSVFPETEDGAVGGWIYLNLNHNAPAGAPDAETASQNWVIVSMEAQGRFSVDFDAAWLENGCSDEVGQTETVFGGSGDPIGPGVAESADDQTENDNDADILVVN
jgi:hypothetical protein